AAAGRRRVDAVLDQHGLERCADENGLPYDPLTVGDLAVLAEAGGDPVVVERPVAAAGDIVLARPDEPHRVLPAGRLSDGGDFRDVVRVGRRAPAEGAAGGEGIDRYLLGLQSHRRGGG